MRETVCIFNTAHLCIFLPKFHCELNFIEFSCGPVKRYLQENCNYTFDTLKENILKALASVNFSTIRKWVHQMVHWMDAYCTGLSTQAAQNQIKEFSSAKYHSH
ncbi:hypothetical protein BDQ12DRAFT_614387 [Crucibulum laeve]|uniref:DDE-1 domain-containing protein n=1 Tax=Crucibulum laeve TaxID=68775 RepID=A0A5C3LNN0_9AGAR|nr:hypothetical protein BDQ12DRAFT_614387 [Crucibulum laeve]